MLGGAGRGGVDERRRAVALAALTLAALLLHAGLLGSLERLGADETTANPLPPALTVRMLAPAAPAPSPVAALPVSPLALLPAPGPVPVPVPEPKRPAVAARSEAQGTTALAPSFTPALLAALQAPAPDPTSAAAVMEPEPPAAAGRTAAPANVPAEALTLPAARPPPETVATGPEALAAPTPPSAADRELPVYRTLIPPPIQLRYQLRRGALQGTGDFQWAPQGERYEARLEGRVAGITVLTQHSQGGFDEAGVAPMRFTDRRGIGALQAANFQREVGKISFSGPSVEYPLLIGAQDRLSWMVQLAAVVAAEPQRLQDGGKVVIQVVGARGDSRLWVFRFVAHEGVRTGAGTVQAARFVRESADPYDTRVEVWLDPLRHHLPARAVLRSGPDDDGLELLVQEPVAVP